MSERLAQTGQQSQTASPISGVLQRKCASCGNHTMAGGECADCAKKKSGLQRKLTIGASNDPLELEADRIADQVLAASSHPAASSVPPHIQRFKGQATEQANIAPASVERVLSSSGSPMETGLRQDMEQRFGYDFSRVRVHSGVAAEQSAQDVNAHAYTVGHNIVFGASQFAPETNEGRRLLAHELTHVVQQSRSDRIRLDQRGGKQNLPAIPDRPAHRLPDTHHKSDAERAAGMLMNDASVQVSETAPGLPIQRFGSKEHRSLGDTATGNAMVNIGGDTPASRFELSHGDVIALSGDYFDPDELMRLGALPGNQGQGVGTRDEIICALKDIDATDPRFLAGGIWHSFVFSDEVKAAVTARYQNLAAQNTSHFFAPRGRAASGQPIRGAISEPSAFHGYRALHERALVLAYTAGGTAAGDISHAMAMEAAAQHFLTDSFSAGHLRTPVALIRSYWGGRYPLFWYNLLHKMALDTAIRMNDIDNNVTTVFGTVQDMYEVIITQVNTIASTLPPITLGDLLSLLFHDFDNEMGLAVNGGRVFGDSHLDEANPENITRAIAQNAILAGNQDVREAFALGGSMPGLGNAEVFRDVRAGTHAPADRYVAETLIPNLNPSNPAQNWHAADFETLWSQPMLGTSGPTVGAQITAAMTPGNEIRDRLDNLATRFPAVENRWSGNVHPRRAYLEGFVQPLARNPRVGLLSIINWAPNYGLRDSDRDNVSLATGNELSSTGRLSGMTTQARAAYVRELIGGNVASTEEALVVDIFATAPATERPRIYQLVEGHIWNGDWVQGLTVSDDDIWNALNSTRLARLRILINAGSTP